MYSKLPPIGHRAAGDRSSRCPPNEIMLHALVFAGYRTEQIADRYDMSIDQVKRLRAAYDL